MKGVFIGRNKMCEKLKSCRVCSYCTERPQGVAVGGGGRGRMSPKLLDKRSKPQEVLEGTFACLKHPELQLLLSAWEQPGRMQIGILSGGLLKERKDVLETMVGIRYSRCPRLSGIEQPMVSLLPPIRWNRATRGVLEPEDVFLCLLRQTQRHGPERTRPMESTSLCFLFA